MRGSCEHELKVRACLVNTGPSLGQAFEILSQCRTSCVKHVSPTDTELTQLQLVERLRVEEPRIHAVMHDDRIPHTEQIDGLLCAEFGYTDDGSRPSRFFCRGRNGRRLIRKSPRNDVVKCDHVTVRRWRQFEVHSVGHRAAAVQDPPQTAPDNT